MGSDDERAALFHVLYTTRALRRLKPDTVPEEVLFQLVDAAVRAPSGQNRQDWRFVVVTDPAIKASMQEAATQAWSRYQPEYAIPAFLAARIIQQHQPSPGHVRAVPLDGSGYRRGVRRQALRRRDVLE